MKHDARQFCETDLMFNQVLGVEDEETKLKISQFSCTLPFWMIAPRFIAVHGCLLYLTYLHLLKQGWISVVIKKWCQQKKANDQTKLQFKQGNPPPEAQDETISQTKNHYRMSCEVFVTKLTSLDANDHMLFIEASWFTMKLFNSVPYFFNNHTSQVDVNTAV